MDGDGERLARKFLGLRVARGGTRRADYRGDRHRLTLRLTDDVALTLHLVSAIGGETRNDLCERVLREKGQQILEDLRTRHDPQTWEILVAHARRRWR